MNVLKSELRATSTVLWAFTSAMGVTLALAIRCAVGSYALALRFVSYRASVMPLWVLSAFELISFFLIGFALGAALGKKSAEREVEPYRGGFYLLLGASLSVIQRFCFFKAAAFFSALVFALLALVCLCVAAVNFSRISRLSFLSLALGTVWVFYIFCLSSKAFFVS